MVKAHAYTFNMGYFLLVQLQLLQMIIDDPYHPHSMIKMKLEFLLLYL